MIIIISQFEVNKEEMNPAAFRNWVKQPIPLIS
jgi:hypothetical protein